MFGTDVETDRTVGGSIVWRGEWEGRPYEDKGEVEVEPPRRLRVTHYSPLTGQPDIPENYHTVTYDLTEHEGATRLRLSQDNNPSQAAAEHSRANWELMLRTLEGHVESS
jgi:hypothetical protein